MITLHPRTIEPDSSAPVICLQVDGDDVVAYATSKSMWETSAKPVWHSIARLPNARKHIEHTLSDVYEWWLD